MNPAAFRPHVRVPLAALAFLVATVWLATGCSTPSEPTDPGASATSTVTILIAVDETSSEARPSGPSAMSLRLGAGAVSALGFSFADVTSIQVDVKDASTGNPLFVNVDLAPTASGWAGVLPTLPQNKLLTFIARARGVNADADAGAGDSVLFNGSTTVALTSSAETVGITLVPINDGATIELPRIKKISIPGEFALGQSGNITFFVEATANRALSYSLTAAASGGGFQPASGSFTMPGASGAFVVRYAPPLTLATPTEFTHELKVTNQEGHSVSTTFKTRVVPPDGTGGSPSNTPTVRVVFNPVINGLAASRTLGTNKVTWTANVADDKPLDGLTYAWSFTPTGTVTPAPSFTAQTNPTVLQGYAPTLEGALTLEVTDGDSGKTTVKYLLAANQFPDQPGQTGGGTDIAQLRAGDAHTCALLNDGSVRCWGAGGLGRLGYGNTDTIGDNELPSSRGAVPLPEKVSQLATGGSHTCALLVSGLVRCWGNNQYGQLGYRHTNHIGDTEPVTSMGYVNLGTPAVRITAGASHTCALLTTNKVRCWGFNGTGQLGYGHTNNIGDDDEPSSVDVQVGAPVQDVFARGNHTCALLLSGKVRCWGDNGLGQLGYSNGGNPIGDNEHPSSVGDVNLGGTAIQLALGGSHTCALMDTGTVKCWGYNAQGQIGNGSSGATFNPVVYDVGLGAGNKAIQVTAGANHTCALLGSGLIKCWGLGSSGQLGYGNTTQLLSPPGNHTGLNNIPAYFLTAGANHTCALLTNGKALCWGLGSSGQLGYANTNSIGDDELPSSQDGISLLAP
ncbi:RCC1 domain-containing protein [Pyxidicoccus sp. MSG2]|uniref:RCC1 domain-containing protein n=1 Tax=Pyxidicoccus sp. MSG2 TaxID=2996790 RepID=UPI002270D911|nr:RTX toxin [Pyxidicoccus sp. MSG2]MCY1018413.1 RTX toxin [Pyxidicoccus sp. MSG2]